MTNRRHFLSSLGLGVAALAAAGCGEGGAPVPPAGAGGDLSNLPEGERLAEKSIEELQKKGETKQAQGKKK